MFRRPLRQGMQALMRRIGKYIGRYSWFAKMLFSREPTYLIFYLTSRCNSRCQTCFNWQQNNPAEPESELSVEEISEIARKARHLYYVTLGGGEPFLREDIAAVCKAFYDNSHTRVFSIPTNCLTPTVIAERVEAMIRACPEAIFRISMSIDGIGELHDRIRGVPGNFAKLNQTYFRLAELRSIYPKLEILANTTFCSENQDHISAIHEHVVRNFSLDMYGITLIRGDVENPAIKRIDINKYAEAINVFDRGLRFMRQRRHPLQRLMAVLPVFTWREVLKTYVAGRRGFACHAISRLIVLDAYGHLYPCEMLKEDLGSLRESDYNLRNILARQDVKSLLARIDSRECSCTWECAIQNSLVFNLMMYPAMVRHAFVKSITGHS